MPVSGLLRLLIVFWGALRGESFFVANFIQMLVVSVLLVPLPALGVFFVVQWLVDSFVRRGAEYQRFERYRRDRDEYQKWKRRREAWLERQQRWENLSGRAFELEFGKLLKGLGYGVRVTPSSGDQGLDLIASRAGREVAVQCKRHKTKTGPAVARELYGAMVASGYTAGMLVSTSGFTQGVHDFVKGKNIELWDLETIRAHQATLPP